MEDNKLSTDMEIDDEIDVEDMESEDVESDEGESPNETKNEKFIRIAEGRVTVNGR